MILKSYRVLRPQKSSTSVSWTGIEVDVHPESVAVRLVGLSPTIWLTNEQIQELAQVFTAVKHDSNKVQKFIDTLKKK